MRLEPDAATRSAIAKHLGLESLPALSGHMTVKAWLDGAEITGRFEGVVEQICGISLDAFEQPVSGEIQMRLVPTGSASVPTELEGGEIELDPEAPDPPDVMDGDTVDLAAYLVEHLALAIDPFPRKPGVVFEPRPEETPASPFAVLAALKATKAAD